MKAGRYHILGKLGAGGKGDVYKARDTMLYRDVAIKVLKATVTSEEAFTCFMTEAKAVANCSLLKVALEVKDKDLIASLNALTATLFRAQKKWKVSIELFEKSLREHEALNAKQWDAYFLANMVLSEYARTYLERDEEGAKEKAHRLLNQALELLQKIGAKKDTQKINSPKDTTHSLGPKEDPCQLGAW